MLFHLITQGPSTEFDQTLGPVLDVLAQICQTQDFMKVIRLELGLCIRAFNTDAKRQSCYAKRMSIFLNFSFLAYFPEVG
jgi:hypothetical protein